MPAQILIIEDNPANMALMVYLLNAFGYGAHSATDGEKGWEAAQQEAFDLILCDVHLPKRDGYEIVRLLKSNPKLQTIPVIAVTALAMVGDREKMLEAGFDSYIGKPIEPTTFVSQIEEFLPPELRTRRLPEGHSAPGTDSASAATVPRELKGATILVVDDTPVNRELIRSTLEPFGCSLLFAENVQQGLQRAQNDRFDLILCDLHMPNEDGFSFIRRLRTNPRLADIPFMFLTASSGRDNDPDEALTLGAARFLRRPIDPQVLVDHIKACLQESDEGEAPPRSD
ncbi:response regulator [Nitrosospira sp. NpAV]|uniref:response regulator n=1 Tax=Nitrosospira sp. NpAV TaxID=58133 RepID=UPI000ADDA1EE|nr:response regulator [Nitrosospira sp. NpAV]